MILITGGLGYIGSNTLFYLLQATTENILVVDNMSNSDQESLSRIMSLDKDRISFMNIDFIEITAEFLLDQKINTVLHFAGSLIVEESMQNPLKYYNNNTLKTTILIEECVRANVSKFIFSSTAAVYKNTGGEFSEDSPTEPATPYGRSKKMIEDILLDTARVNENFEAVIFRYFNVAGANLEHNLGCRGLSATHLFKIASEAVSGKRDLVKIFGNNYNTPDGTCVRDYIHVQDLAKAHVLGYKYLLNKGKTDIFNVGYGKGVSVKEALDAVKEIYPDLVIEYDKPRFGDIDFMQADITKISKVLNFKQEFSMKDICISACEFEKKN